MTPIRATAKRGRLAAAALLAAAGLIVAGGAASASLTPANNGQGSGAASGHGHPNGHGNPHATSSGSAAAQSSSSQGTQVQQGSAKQSTQSSQGKSNHTSAGHANKGDVWTDNVGQPAGPGHEQDPHLACANINLWGSALADGSGTYTIDGWPPSGTQKQAYAASWTYTSAGGSQVMSVINVTQLIAAAVHNGDAPINKQGFHFKLQFVQDPQKHKTFWVKCPVPTSVTGATPTPSGSVLGITTGPGSGGVAGLSVGTPSTGTAVALGLALALIGTGAALVIAGRRRRAATGR